MSDSERLEPRAFPVECYSCDSAFDAHNETHYILTENSRPIPEREDMVFDDWFASNYYICEGCADELIDLSTTDGERSEDSP